MNPDKIEMLLTYPPFGYTKSEKRNILEPAMHQSINFHIKNCEDIEKYYKEIGFRPELKYEMQDIPYLPTDIFKKRDILSVPKDEILYTLYSSATTGRSSKIFLDRTTALRQQIISSKILIHYLGKVRKPYLILDVDPENSDGIEIKSQSAASRGLLPFASSTEYFLEYIDETMRLDLEKLLSRMNYYKEQNSPVTIFGFTYILYINMIRELLSLGKKIELPEGSQIIHIGGWKKLSDKMVTKTEFLNSIKEVLSIDKENVLDIYGFTEQMGLLYISRGLEPKTIPFYCDLIIRDIDTLKEAETGESGLIQILTPFPRSYPGISILTGDIGRIVTDNRFGKRGDETRFEIFGPSQSQEVRGCGDVLADVMGEN